MRSATSVGANYEESRGADSRADFCYKMQIALKEVRETRYWLCLIAKAEIVGGEEIGSLIREAFERGMGIRTKLKPQT